MEELIDTLIDDVQSSIMLILSGGGSPRKSCGEPKFVVICNEHKDEKIVFHNECTRLQCPVCMESKAKRLAKAAADRVYGLKKAYEKEGIKLGRLKHISFNKDPSFVIEDDLIQDKAESLNKELQMILKKAFKDGFYAGCIVFHPCRKKHNDGSECRKGKECHQDHDWVFGPHYHFIGYGYIERQDSFMEKYRWNYSNIIENERGRNVFATVYYELTHAGIFIDEYGKQLNQVVRWVGGFSNAKGGKKKVSTTFEYQLCPICKRPMVKYGYDPADSCRCNWSYEQGEYQKRVDKYEWYLVHKQKQKKL